MLFVVWDDKTHRPTRDLDLLGFGPSEKKDLEKLFREVVALPVVEDGLSFDPASVRAEEIREDNAYGGVRIRAQTGSSTRASLHAEVCRGVASLTEIATRSAQVAFDVSHADHESEISPD